MKKSIMEIENNKPTISRDRRPEALGNLRVLPDEILCAILASLSPRDVARLSCVSSVMYILCNEEPLWMSLCLNNITRQLQYKGSWKKTTLDQLQLLDETKETSAKPMYFDGFNSLFLLRRHYRCYTTLAGFNFDDGNVARKKDLTLEDFHCEFDGKKPVLISGLTDTWLAKRNWTIHQLIEKYGDTVFKISQRSTKKISINFKDYISYTNVQHDEDPLYIFDEKFGETAPDLLKDYNVPHLFQEDFFDVLDREKRPPFRWFIIGPERSGASWHVDPALTSAWNTLICGRKRWALYPPGRVPLGVTVHVNEDDGDVNIETPTSLQWWLDFYPLLPDEDKPIECTQLPGETIYVPSGWWHCVLNLETSVAVTQNYVNSANFEFVCLDMAPGYQHKGVCRAGLLAIDQGTFEGSMEIMPSAEDSLIGTDLLPKEKKIKTCEPELEHDRNINPKFHDLEFSYDISFLKKFLDRERDHYNFPWSSGNCIGQRELREWLSKLWDAKPDLRELIWKGACIALNANKWFQCAREICSFHNLSFPTEDDKLPVGTGSNPVYLIADHVVKIYVEGGLKDSILALGSELEFYSLLHKVNSPLKEHIPGVLASGILYIEDGSYKIIPWDGRGVPDVISNSGLIPENNSETNFSFGFWSKIIHDFRKAGMSENGQDHEISKIWPYIVIKRCKGKIYADLRDTLSWEETLSLASFLGEKVRALHSLPYPSLNSSLLANIDDKNEYSCANNSMEAINCRQNIPAEWELFIRTLIRRKNEAASRLTKWGDPIPSSLIAKIDEYIPVDFAKLMIPIENGEVHQSCTWIHSDIMDDNIHMECVDSCDQMEHTSDAELLQNGDVNGCHGNKAKTQWRGSHILDFSDLSIGDPICDLIPIHLDIFRGHPDLLKQFLASYKLPLARKTPESASPGSGSKFGRLSYITMCYCILHEENVLGAIFGLWKELRSAKSWDEVEETVWGNLNNYTASD